MITVDANVVAYAFIEGESTKEARRIWRTDPEWCLPILFFFRPAKRARKLSSS